MIVVGKYKYNYGSNEVNYLVLTSVIPEEGQKTIEFEIM